MPETLLQRNQAILHRMETLRPVEDRIRQVFLDGKREQIRTSRDTAGSRFQPLARSTLEQPRQDPRPFLKHGEASSILTQYFVRVETDFRRIVVTAGWPMEWPRYHIAGGRRLPRRDIGGFREQDTREAMQIFREYVINGR
jgi:hypothetical protein